MVVLFGHIFLFFLGVALVYLGAEGTTQGGGDLARRLAINPILIGITIVAFGTSAPELFVSGVAALGSEEVVQISLGNIIGSNIANVGLAIGAPLLLSPLAVSSRKELGDTIVMLVLTGIFIGVSFLGTPGEFALFEGSILLILFLMFMTWIFKRAVSGPSSPEIAEDLKKQADSDQLLSIPYGLLYLFGGLALLVGGAELMVGASVDLAEQYGLSTGLIGVTLVAFGTSVPELAIMLLGILRKKTTLSIGSIVGSNIFNLLLVGGTIAVIAPRPISMEGHWRSLAVLVFFSLVLTALVARNRDLGWKTGTFLLAGYIGFLIFAGWNEFAAL